MITRSGCRMQMTPPCPRPSLLGEAKQARAGARALRLLRLRLAMMTGMQSAVPQAVEQQAFQDPAQVVVGEPLRTAAVVPVGQRVDGAEDEEDLRLGHVEI